MHRTDIDRPRCSFPAWKLVADLVLVEDAHEIGQLGSEFTRKRIRFRRSILRYDGLPK